MLEDVLIGIGDIHGHYPALTRLIEDLDVQYGLFPNQDGVLRDNASIVFIGDYIDRGEDSFKVIQGVMKLSKNPNVHCLIGNHELLALESYDEAVEIFREVERVKDMKDNPLEFSQLRTSWGRDGFSQYYETLHGYNGGGDTIRSFGDDEASAFENYVKKMSKNGGIKRWIHKAGSYYLAEFFDKKILFIHADLPWNIETFKDIQEYEKKYRKHMKTSPSKFGGSIRKYHHQLIMEEGLFWERRFGYLNEDSANSIVDNLGVDHLVTGHTPNRGQIKSHFGRIFNIDVGMCPNYGEHTPTAVVFKKEGVYGFYSGIGEENLSVD